MDSIEIYSLNDLYEKELKQLNNKVIDMFFAEKEIFVHLENLIFRDGNNKERVEENLPFVIEKINLFDKDIKEEPVYILIEKTLYDGSIVSFDFSYSKNRLWTSVNNKKQDISNKLEIEAQVNEHSFFVKSIENFYKIEIINDKNEEKLLRTLDKKIVYENNNISFKKQLGEMSNGIKFIDETYISKTAKFDKEHYLSLFKTDPEVEKLLNKIFDKK